MSILNLRELEQSAKEKLPRIAYDYFSSGAWDEATLNENQDAFNRLLASPRHSAGDGKRQEKSDKEKHDKHGRSPFRSCL